MRTLSLSFVGWLTVGLLLAGCKPKEVPAQSDPDTQRAGASAPQSAPNAVVPPPASSTEPNASGSSVAEHTRQAMAVLRTEDVDRPLDQIQTALHVIGFPEAIVQRIEPDRLLVAFNLKTEQTSREMVTKTAMILSTVAGFEKSGQVAVVGFQHTHPMLAIRGDISQTIRATRGELPWPDYLASLTVEPVTDQSGPRTLRDLLAW